LRAQSHYFFHADLADLADLVDLADFFIPFRLNLRESIFIDNSLASSRKLKKNRNIQSAINIANGFNHWNTI
jgi:hypothetical protein